MDWPALALAKALAVCARIKGLYLRGNDCADRSLLPGNLALHSTGCAERSKVSTFSEDQYARGWYSSPFLPFLPFLFSFLLLLLLLLLCVRREDEMNFKM